MSKEIVYILDADESRTDFFKNSLKEDGYDTNILSDIASSIDQLADETFLIILIDYRSIVTADRNKVISFFKILNNRNVIVYNVPEDANRRLAFYELGARWVYDSSYSLEEVYYSLRWLLSILSSEFEGHRLFSKGNLEDMPLPVLISTLGRENRSGILKIVTENNSGKIYFYNGDIDDARVGIHSGESAVFHMLFWKKGAYTFASTQQENPVNNIRLSNIGLLLLAENFREKYIAYLKELGSVYSVIRVKNVGDLLISNKDIDKKFIEHLENPHEVKEILENLFYTCYETVEKLLQLKRDGFLIFKEPDKAVSDESVFDDNIGNSGLDEIILNKNEIIQLKENLNIEDKRTGKLIILGSRSAGKTEFIRQLTKSKSAVQNEKDIDLAHIQLGAELDLLLFGVVMDQMVIGTVENISEGLVGYIFLIDGKESEEFKYINYIINHLINKYPVSIVIAVTNISTDEEKQSVCSKFKLPGKINWVIYQPNDLQSVRKALLALKPLDEIQEEKLEEKEAEE